ncbi:MAG: phosphoglycolate phosphatase [Maricaulaceae bacterium]
MTDWCTPDGARRLQQRIESYWRERGYEVSITLIDAGFMPAMRSARTDVRSDMVNGLPSRRIANDSRPVANDRVETARLDESVA